VIGAQQQAEGRVRLRLDRGVPTQPSAFSLDVDFALPKRGVTALFGPSGSGKTSVLRAVAGLERSARGLVDVGGTCWQDDARGCFLPTWKRPIGYVFQEASLFEHLDVSGNLRFGMPKSSTSSQGREQARQAQAALDAAVDLLGIGGLKARRSQDLSGGERQRVAIARALASQPQLLLLDEPMASLDAARKQEILPWLERLRDELSIPMLYVSHSVQEVARLASHLVVLAQGRVQSAGPIDAVLAELDASPALDSSWGEEAGVWLSAQVGALDAQHHLALLQIGGSKEDGVQGGGVQLWLAHEGLRLGQTVRLRLAARDVSLSLQEPQRSSIQNHWPAVIERIEPEAHPAQCRVDLRCAGTRIQARVTQRAAQALGLRVGLSVWAQVKTAALAR
jgi:molybdate transport system ATP-binding protein